MQGASWQHPVHKRVFMVRPARRWLLMICAAAQCVRQTKTRIVQPDVFMLRLLAPEVSQGSQEASGVCRSTKGRDADDDDDDDATEWGEDEAPPSTSGAFSATDADGASLQARSRILITPPHSISLDSSPGISLIGGRGALLENSRSQAWQSRPVEQGVFQTGMSCMSGHA